MAEIIKRRVGPYEISPEARFLNTVNLENYNGNWIAVVGSSIVDHAQTFRQIVERVDPSKRPVFAFVWLETLL